MMVILNKPSGMTSHDVVNRVRTITGIKRVGHGGTLDPLASGVLVVAIGRENTKQLGRLLHSDKEYVVGITLGGRSTTDDAEGEIIENYHVNSLPLNQIEAVLEKFQGEITQIPPQFSAIKQKGKKAYEQARKGVRVEIPSRQVTIYKLELLRYEWPELELKVHCSKGTYVRSLARDVGEALGVGGYVSKLERTRVGEYTLEQALSLEEFEQQYKQGALG
jgi:tRNA pseudouridine55 synthase